MRNAMNIYKRKDGRFEGRIPLGYDNKGRLKYRYLYSKNLTELKEKMLSAYAESGNPTSNTCGKTLRELCCEWLASAKLRVKHSSYCCYEKLINKHVIPYFEEIGYGELGTPTGTNKPIEPRTMQNRFKAVLKECGIRSANFHLLRHQYVKYTTKKYCVFSELFLRSDNRSSVRKSSEGYTQFPPCYSGTHTPVLSAVRQESV